MDQKGITLLELLTVLTVLSIMVAVAIPNIKVLDDPLKNATSSSLIFLQLARAKAISRTQYARVYPAFNNQIITAFGSDCDSATDIDPSVQYNFPQGASLSSTLWSVCFTPRGFSQTNTSFEINNLAERASVVEVSLGGGAREQ